MKPVMNRLVLYARDPQRTATFYETHFGFVSKADADGGIIELTSPHGGAS